MVKQEYFPILVGIFIQVYMENSHFVSFGIRIFNL